MKVLSRRVALSSVLFLATSASPGFASVGSVNPLDPITDTMNEISEYLLNLGKYLGYNLKDAPSSQVNEVLLQVTTNALQNVLLPTVKSLYGALPVNMAGLTQNTGQENSLPFFVPTNNTMAVLNNSGNSTFVSSSFDNPSNNVSVSALIDQPGTTSTSNTDSLTFQKDPVSQSIANMLMTPDYSYCLDNASKNWVGCTYPAGVKNENQVMLNVLGGILPGTNDFFKGAFNLPAITQLNSNSLIAPLMYSLENTIQQATPLTAAISPPQDFQLTGPLTAQTSAQQANNFIRYASAMVAPIPLATRSFYDKLYQQYTNSSGTLISRFQAGSALASYLINLRVYAAQTSVGISNLYYILSKRMQQPIVIPGKENVPPTSQALSEYTMATWRLFDPNQNTTQQGNTQWLSGLDNASAATVQKEIAVLLAEINYQLYLNRQQEERILLTNSILLLQNSRTMQLNGFLRASSDSSSGGSNSDSSGN
ncbi:type IVB secretion system protein IcmX [Legionella hackeliae]|uniref:IcmX protein n=1 Tax=Legionella hackeliae TaxID=449 RepID=A0A0A8UX80_LEGHA|nr:type IVB secretion system protein IcmX [Legionella hackeliae]KTD09986.1 IcmX (IcmY) [Legionella hackeliae]CEK11712.1 IcmX protein [Legionella hackeliae]STX48482.1 IcmX (IcmY) [Legionella hackeliae]